MREALRKVSSTLSQPTDSPSNHGLRLPSAADNFQLIPTTHQRFTHPQLLNPRRADTGTSVTTYCGRVRRRIGWCTPGGGFFAAMKRLKNGEDGSDCGLALPSRIRKSSEEEDTECTLFANRPEHLIEKIVANVPYPNVFRARCLSKTWCSQLSETAKVPGAASLRGEIELASSRWPCYAPVILQEGKQLCLRGYDPGSRTRRTIRVFEHRRKKGGRLPASSTFQLNYHRFQPSRVSGDDRGRTPHQPLRIRRMGRNLRNVFNRGYERFDRQVNTSKLFLQGRAGKRVRTASGRNPSCSNSGLPAMSVQGLSDGFVLAFLFDGSVYRERTRLLVTYDSRKGCWYKERVVFVLGEDAEVGVCHQMRNNAKLLFHVSKKGEDGVEFWECDLTGRSWSRCKAKVELNEKKLPYDEYSKLSKWGVVFCGSRTFILSSSPYKVTRPNTPKAYKVYVLEYLEGEAAIRHIGDHLFRIGWGILKLSSILNFPAVTITCTSGNGLLKS